MSATAFLDTLKKYNLYQYYPVFVNKGIKTNDQLLPLTMEDYSKLGVRSLDDKRKFRDLAQDIRTKIQKQQQFEHQRLQQLELEQQRQQQQQQQQLLKKEQQQFKGSQVQQMRKDSSPVIPVDYQRKRTPTSFQTSDRKARRLTVGSPSSQRIQYPQRQNITSPIPQSAPNRNDSSPINNRRLSYAPSSKYAKLSPVRNNNFGQAIQQKSSPSRNTTSISVAANKSPIKLTKKQLGSSPFRDDDLSSEKKKVIPVQQQQPDRHLDAYGIPKLNTKRRLSLENSSTVTNDNTLKSTNSNPYTGLSLDEFMESRYASRHANTSTVATGLKLSSNTTAPSTPSTTKTSILARPLSNDLQQRIRVCVRKRPLSKKEIALGDPDIAQLVGPHTIQLNAPKTRVDLTRYTEQHSFTFDEAFSSDSTNTEIYHKTARPLVNYVFNGGKATCFAFGQTGSGKTFTMLDPEQGLYIMAAKDIFEMLEDSDYNHLSASVGFYEIYQGKLYDLLNKRKQLIPRDDGNNNVVISGLLEYPIGDLDRLLQIFGVGNRSRTTGKTGANDNSSRSHAVLQVLLKNKKTNSIHGKLSFIDLAGSERGADRGDANTKTRLEGAEINKSLLALKECIRALDKDKKHKPFRGSKLTQVLRDSFVGDSRTCMIATISPNNSNSEHTLDTLRYADRVKELKGESDPRLQPDLPLLDSTLERSYTRQNSSQRDDAQSEATFDEFWDEEAAENLMDVDFPADAISNSAMRTPRSQRTWPETTVSQSQEQHPRRPPSSLAGERFRQDEENPFLFEHDALSLSSKSPRTQPRYSSDSLKTTTPSSRLSVTSVAPHTELSTHSTPLQDTFYDADDGSRPILPTTAVANSSITTTTTTNHVNYQVSTERVHGFTRLLQAQIKVLENCIRQEKEEVTSDLALTIPFSTDDEHTTNTAKAFVQNEKALQQNEAYLNNLEDILDYVNTLKNRVKRVLADEKPDGTHGTDLLI